MYRVHANNVDPADILGWPTIQVQWTLLRFFQLTMTETAVSHLMSVLLHVVLQFVFILCFAFPYCLDVTTTILCCPLCALKEITYCNANVIVLLIGNVKTILKQFLCVENCSSAHVMFIYQLHSLLISVKDIQIIKQNFVGGVFHGTFWALIEPSFLLVS